MRGKWLPATLQKRKALVVRFAKDLIIQCEMKFYKHSQKW